MIILDFQRQCQNWFQKPVQERVPGGLPGMRSWRSSRNAIFEKLKTVCSLMKWGKQNFKTLFLLKGDGVK